MLADEPRLAAILAEVEGGEPMILAPGYPRAWLLALTQDLARRVKDSALDPLFDPPPLKIAVVESAVDDAHGFLERPSGSGIVVEHHPDEVTFIVPPPGVGRDARGCVFLLVGVMFLTGALLCMLGAAGIVTLQGDPWAALGVCLLCGLILLTGAIELGRRRVVLVVAGFTLRVTTDSPFRYREHFWPRGVVRHRHRTQQPRAQRPPAPGTTDPSQDGEEVRLPRRPESRGARVSGHLTATRSMHMPAAAVEQHHKPWS